MTAEELGLPARSFERRDDGLDLDFYAPPRLVTHIDASATAALTDFYRATIRAGGRILDLMSSWISHLPDDVAYTSIVGHGMNATELSANPRLDRWFIQDLNRDPAIDEADASYDAVLMCVGAQYLQRPLAVFREARRVLRSGAPMIVSFSNRCFPTKAVAIWQALDASGQAALIQLYFDKAGFEDVVVHNLADSGSGDPLVAVVGRA